MYSVTAKYITLIKREFVSTCINCSCLYYMSFPIMKILVLKARASNVANASSRFLSGM